MLFVACSAVPQLFAMSSGTNGRRLLLASSLGLCFSGGTSSLLSFETFILLLD